MKSNFIIASVFIAAIFLGTMFVPEISSAADAGRNFSFAGENYAAVSKIVKPGIGEKEFKVQILKGSSPVYDENVIAMQVKIIIAKNFFGKGNDGVVIVESSGSGGFMNWYLLKGGGQSFTKAFGKTEIFQGEIKISGTMIEEWVSGRKTAYNYSGGKVATADAKEPDPDMNTIQLDFKVLQTGRVVLAEKGIQNRETAFGTEASLNIGVNQTLKLLKVGGGPDVRFIIQDDGMLNKVGPNGWRAVKTGVTYVDVIPNGYSDQDKKLVLIIKILR